MIRKILIAAAATFVVGAVSLASFEDASARGHGGGGMSRGGGGGMRMGGGGGFRGGRIGGGRVSHVGRVGRGGRPGLTRRPGGHRPGNIGGHRRHGSHAGGHRRHGSHGGHHRRHGSHGHHHRRHGSFGGHHHRHGSFGRFHRRHFSWGGGVVVSGGTYGVGTTYATPVPAAGPACYTCGGWTDDGCYMTYRKVVDANGNPELKCVKACDETPAQQQSQAQ
jgi:hypothetical protein